MAASEPPYPNIFSHQIDRRINIDRLIINLLNLEACAWNRPRFQLIHGILNALHGQNNIGPGFALGVKGQGLLAQNTNIRRGHFILK